jgi:hypothetical protein
VIGTNISPSNVISAFIKADAKRRYYQFLGNTLVSFAPIMQLIQPLEPMVASPFSKLRGGQNSEFARKLYKDKLFFAHKGCDFYFRVLLIT